MRNILAMYFTRSSHSTSWRRQGRLLVILGIPFWVVNFGWVIDRDWLEKFVGLDNGGWRRLVLSVKPPFGRPSSLCDDGCGVLLRMSTLHNFVIRVIPRGSTA